MHQPKATVIDTFPTESGKSYLSSLLSTWKVRSITEVHCRHRMTNVLGLGRSVFISWHSAKAQTLQLKAPTIKQSLDIALTQVCQPEGKADLRQRSC